MYLSKIFRKVSVALLAATLCVCTVIPYGTVNAALAKGDKFIGNIVNKSIPDNYSSYWNHITPVNATMWNIVETSRDEMNWISMGMIHSYCIKNNIPFTFNALITGGPMLSWLSNISTNEQRAEILEWIDAAGKMYNDAQMVNVVNNPLHEKPYFRNAIGGDGSTGWDWVVWSFEQARRSFPNSKLLINDYGIINDQNAATQYLGIINLLKSKNLIDGIGIDCSSEYMDTITISRMQSVLGLLAQTGVPIYISELSISGDDNTQLARYQEKFPVLYENPAVKGITFGGYMEPEESWVFDTKCLVTKTGSERPALKWLREYLAGGWSATPTVTPEKTGDLNRDGVINMSDVMLIATAFNSIDGDSKYIEAYDLNNDGSINMTDVMLIASKFNQRV